MTISMIVPPNIFQKINKWDSKKTLGFRRKKKGLIKTDTYPKKKDNKYAR